MSSKASSKLFQPLKLGNAELKQRIALAPLTRFRAIQNHIPTVPLSAEYYAQRGSSPGTLLVTEATLITPRAGGYDNVPGIWNQDQIEAWKQVTSAVHDKGSIIYLQLWALGRVAPLAGLQKDAGADATVISASTIPNKGDNYAKPRPLTTDEIKSWTQDFAQAARNAISAGFDGVEIHGANGYLLDQFTQDVSNDRTDEYGGSIENRSRFGLEVAKAVADAVGPERTGYRISPYSTFQDMKMAEPVPQFVHLVKGLSDLKLAYVHLTESQMDNGKPRADYTPYFEAWGSSHGRPFVLCGGYNEGDIFETVDEKYPNVPIVVAVGRPFLATPDYVQRLRDGVAVNAHDRPTFYWNPSVGPLRKGYTDYPFANELAATAQAKA